MRNVLVTGGSGFIGRYVVEELQRRHYEVSILDTRDKGVPNVTLHFGDIRDDVAVTEAAAHADGIIHLAGVLGTQETITNPRPAAGTNILGGLNVLEAAAQYKLPMVNIAVGNFWMNNTYSLTKNTVERFVDMFNRNRGTKITTVRALNAYGPRQVAVAPYGPSKVRKIMPSFVCRALDGKPIEIYGDGEQIMDMIYVADVARVLVQALEVTALTGAPVKSTCEHSSAFDTVGGTLEAGSGRPTTVNEIATMVLDEVRRVTGFAPDLVHLPMRPGEDANSVVLGDPKSLGALGMDGSDFVTLEKGVVDTVNYFMAEMAF